MKVTVPTNIAPKGFRGRLAISPQGRNSPHTGNMPAIEKLWQPLDNRADGLMTTEERI
jgi:hypothetical protein